MSELKQDHRDPTFRSALTCDHWNSGSNSEYSMVPTSLIGDIQRAAAAISTISRLVHNSLCEPDMTGAEPLGHSAHLGLMNAAELIGRHLRETAEKMYESADAYSNLDQLPGACHE
jgi:hypothetical protein